ncbi:hypothetical protein J8273_8574 [Carpediemonas membranifera]|uniref:Uncharacterized protein n=1 Tax=Carpediemonas membranifera TaxID=201153 RepID=A0A8J6E6T4_9EUKA|nr:hypothetical protein J8273_8574 [Carpediemonas membranifera]|eukprot:KAG9389890.1 hypothetical protein J8273_8574 [Carpediemonas membranifera]
MTTDINAPHERNLVLWAAFTDQMKTYFQTTTKPDPLRHFLTPGPVEDFIRGYFKPGTVYTDINDKGVKMLTCDDLFEYLVTELVPYSRDRTVKSDTANTKPPSPDAISKKRQELETLERAIVLFKSIGTELTSEEKADMQTTAREAIKLVKELQALEANPETPSVKENKEPVLNRAQALATQAEQFFWLIRDLLDFSIAESLEILRAVPSPIYTSDKLATSRSVLEYLAKFRSTYNFVFADRSDKSGKEHDNKVSTEVKTAFLHGLASCGSTEETKMRFYLP